MLVFSERYAVCKCTILFALLIKRKNLSRSAIKTYKFAFRKYVPFHGFFHIFFR
jgi:hypothetical protein